MGSTCLVLRDLRLYKRRVFLEHLCFKAPGVHEKLSLRGSGFRVEGLRGIRRDPGRDPESYSPT